MGVDKCAVRAYCMGMNTNAVARTPGFNRRLTIYFSTDRRGQRRAYYVGSMMRAFPLPVADAETFIANDTADKIAGHPFAKGHGYNR
jgi:hypothetical protein